MRNYLWIILFAVIIIASFMIIWQKKLPNNQPDNTQDETIFTAIPTINSENSPEPITEYQVPILMYHYIRDFSDPNDELGAKLSVSPETFAEQLQWLKDNGYQTVNPDYLLTPYALPLKPVILTFDDGYRDAYTVAYPILKKYDFAATFYIITDYIEKGNPRYLAWDQVREMKAGGMNIGSHTLTHPDLEKCTTDRVNRELVDSKKLIEDKIGSEVTDFCYPSGKYNQEIVTQVENAGYKTATTVKSGIADQDSKLFELPRFRIQNETNLENILK